MKSVPTVAVMLGDAIKSKKSKRPIREAPYQVTPTEPTPDQPTPAERMVNRAHDAKVRATGDWVEGHITSKKHAQIHSRADKVIKAKGCIK